MLAKWGMIFAIFNGLRYLSPIRKKSLNWRDNLARTQRLDSKYDKRQPMLYMPLILNGTHIMYIYILHMHSGEGDDTSEIYCMCYRKYVSGVFVCVYSRKILNLYWFNYRKTFLINMNLNRRGNESNGSFNNDYTWTKNTSIKNNSN